MAKQEIILGGGCFWCLEASFQILKGVNQVISGYANGSLPNPTTEDRQGADIGTQYRSTMFFSTIILDI